MHEEQKSGSTSFLRDNREHFSYEDRVEYLRLSLEGYWSSQQTKRIRGRRARGVVLQEKDRTHEKSRNIKGYYWGLSTYSFIPQIFIESVLWVSYSTRHWGYKDIQKEKKKALLSWNKVAVRETNIKFLKGEYVTRNWYKFSKGWKYESN